MVDFVFRRALREKADKARLERLEDQLKELEARAKVANAKLFRHTEFTLTNIATGTGTTQDVTWNVPIGGDYSVLWSVTCAAAAIGLVSLGVQAGSKTPTGCTLVVANRTGAQLGAAAFDVLAFPL